MAVTPLRLAAIDLDGTLLRTDGTLSERTKQAVRRATDSGSEIVLVTARGPATMHDFAVELGVGGEAICSNGAVVVDLATQELRRERLLATDVAIRLVHALRERIPGIRFAVEHQAFSHELGFSAWNWTPPAGTRVADAIDLLDTPATKLILRHAEHEVEAIAAVARDLAAGGATVVASGSQAVEVTAAGVNKATALAELCETLGIEAADVVAFGDYPNDVPMLAWAGHAVAVANAHPDVIAIADEVTASNDEDGVALVLERLSA